ncbi:hypothetical protein CAPTEDRAFT_193982 [Capitella teleta]|uniref:Alpha-2-macroglobulin bait region domain-containing protein n=1 Tax=Capitella teleta TaxID=283909 RepID=R7UKL7_CAPTE|nr:hypothetical protein CAPTEDRAFT_193982 [Capitella teleta]|eukprot:ELU06775.1 hypothetical protein CAPTEDRAFT_193982 [Capitella teleta]
MEIITLVTPEEISVERSDGSPYIGRYNRQVNIMRMHEGVGAKSVPEEKRVIPDDSLIKYTFFPGDNDVKIKLSAYHPETGSQTELQLFRYYSKSNRYLSITTQNNRPVVRWKILILEREFLVLAPRKVRPMQVYELHATLFRLDYPEISMHAILSCNEEEYASGSVTFTTEGTKVIQMQVPLSVTAGKHHLVVEGLVEGRNTIFRNTTEILFDSKYVSLFIITDMPIYYPPQTVNFRIVGTTKYLQSVSGSIIIYVKGHVYEKHFEVRLLWLSERIFHVNVTTPIYTFDTEWGIAGSLGGIHTFSRIPAWGNATIELTAKSKNGSSLTGSIRKTIGYFEGTVPFEYTMREMKDLWGDLGGKELHFKGWIYDWYHLNIQNGTSVTKVLRDGVTLRFLGKKIRTFKPHSPITVYISVERSDGSPYIGRYNRQVNIMRMHEGVGAKSVPEEKRVIPDDSLIKYTFFPGDNDVKIKLSAYHPETGSQTELQLFRYYSKSNRYLSITTQNNRPVTDEYMTLTVRTNFFVEEIRYLIVAGSEILLGSTLQMRTRQKTFAIAISRKMSPTSKIVAYCVVEREIIMDSLVMFVEDRQLVKGELEINLGKDFTRDTFELITRGTAASWVGVSGVDYEYYRRGADPFLRKEQVIKELMSYTQPADLPFVQTWHHNDARWEDSIFFSAPTTGMDTLTTVETSGLVALTDMNMTARQEYTSCNLTLGYGLCPNGQCYELSRKCDGFIDCLDGYDEITCPQEEGDIWHPRPPEIKNLHMMPRYFDSTEWMWKVRVLKPNHKALPRFKVPELPNPVVLGAFYLDLQNGLYLAKTPVEYNTGRDFFMRSEAPHFVCRGEQFGVRLGMFNMWDQELEVLVMLHGSDDYRFIRVEDFGQVSSYNPRLLAGDIQTMVTMTTERVCVTFQADRWIPVANMSIPHSIEFRNYGEEGISTQTAWESYTLFHLHICQVCGSFQCPYCDFYNHGAPMFPQASMFMLSCVLAFFQLIQRLYV